MADAQGITGRALRLTGTVLRPGLRAAGSATAFAIDKTLESPLVEAVGEAVAKHRVIERVARPIAESGALDQLVLDAIGSPITDRLAERVLSSPAADHLVARVIESELVDHIVVRLLASDDLWILVDEIAASPAVTAAISRQGMGLADQFADVVRVRSNRADDRLERGLRRVLRRNNSNPDPPPEVLP